jgi:quercetin dioxygenase-like cupin family protein/DNA-binding XRE family transcriptional regulator
VTGVNAPTLTHETAALGIGIRAERLRQNMTLARLAERTGLSPSALSQIERGVTDPSIGSYGASGRRCGIFVPAGHESPDRVVHKSQRRTTFPNRTLQYQLLTPHLRGPFEVLTLDLAPGAGSGDEALGHDSEECMIILSGEVEVEVAGVPHALSAGDSISIQRNAPHRAVNVGCHNAEILMVISPADTF